ncbi:methyltransferase domain-containing protein [Rubripirellula amarantea]|nr:methyltransferase domain-containing protein [Rubripirellula amarantea]
MQVHNLPDRKYVREEILPAVKGEAFANVLLVGTRRYTVSYPAQLASPGTLVWTVDLDPSAAKFGNGKHHQVGDVCEVAELFPDLRFDAVMANGLLGFGIDSLDDIRRFADAMYESLQPGGFLMLGWDADRTADPTSNSDIAARFDHAPMAALPKRKSFVGCAGFDHVFDWFRRKPEWEAEQPPT